MSGRYEVEDLLKLRASPLITKPPNLPPIEEWMGAVDLNPRRPALRGKNEENSNTTETFQKRPNLLDTQSRRSTTDPERIHLGPPRRSFASSTARKFGIGDGDETAPKERSSHHERTRTSDSMEYKHSDRKGGYTASNGRHGGRQEGDSHARRQDEDSIENRPRRDLPKWGPRENKDTDQERSKFDQPWIRKGKVGDSLDEGRKETPAWRRTGADRDSGLAEKNEAAPEWADSLEDAGPAKAHTHEDFLLWMENMKSKTSGENKPAQAGPAPGNSQVTDVKKKAASAASAVAPDASIDKFFAKFEEKKIPVDPAASAKPVKSRFASIFNNKAEVKPDQPLPQGPPDMPSPIPAVAVNDSSPQGSAPDSEKKANDEAFAKLLQMLNKNQTNSTQLGPQPPKTHTPEYSRSQVQSPDLATLFGRNQNAPHASSHTPNQSLDRLLESRSPAEQANKHTPKATTDDLLSLLRRSNLNENHQPQQHSQHHEQRPPPGLFSDLEVRDRPPPSFEEGRWEPTRSPFDEFAYGGLRYREAMESQQPSQRRPDNNAANMFAEMSNDSFRQNAQHQSRPMPSQGNQGLPGLQRPPGLENMPRMPPGWPNQPPPMPQHSQPRQGPPPPPPPGINPPSRGIAPYSGPPQPPNFPNNQQQRMPPRKQTSESSAPPGFANGMPPPPPGFGPPHGFTSPPGPMPNMGRYAMGGGMGLADRERVERQGIFADMYGGGGSSGYRGSGGVGVPPGFK